MYEDSLLLLLVLERENRETGGDFGLCVGESEIMGESCCGASRCVVE